MLKRKVRALEMLNAVGELYKKNKVLIEANPALKVVFIIFITRLFELNGWVQFTKKEITGITTNKKELKQLLADEIDLQAAQVYSWANINNDTELMKAMNYKAWELVKLADTDMEKTCGAILEVIVKRNDELGDHKIEAGMLNYVTELLNNFRGKHPEKRIAVVSRGAAIKNNSREVSALIAFLEKSVDGLMKRFKKTDRILYDEYMAAREILDAGSRETKVSGEVSGPDGAPLFNAQAEAVEVEKGTRYKAVSNSKGIYDLKITEAGRYKLVVTCDGFSSSTTGPFDISPGDQLKVNVTLKP